MEKLGIIGGLGPMATAYFLQLLTQMSDAGRDQDHMELLMVSRPSIPDRTNYILGMDSGNPVHEIVSAGRLLKEMGADMLAIPCVTMHCFYDDLRDGIGLPIINIVEETVKYLKRRGIEKVGLLATDGTIRSGFLRAALRKQGISSVLPSDENQKKIMSVIYDGVKAGREADIDFFFSTAEDLFQKGAQINVLGCTELSFIKRDNKLEAGYVDMLELLAGIAVRRCGRLRAEYWELIS